MQPSHHFETFGEFWPYYLRQHSRPLTRGIHCVGTVIVVLMALYFLWLILTWTWEWMDLVIVPAGFVVGYGFAWFAHFVIEKNRPATFLYFKWSLYADFKMTYFILTGKMRDEASRVLK